MQGHCDLTELTPYYHQPLFIPYLPTSSSQNKKPYLTNDLLKPSNKTLFSLTTVENSGICIYIFPFLEVIATLKI